jgi:hypothetical protein
MGSAGLGSVSSAATISSLGGTVSAHEGVGFCIGSAGLGSAVPRGVDAAGSTGGFDIEASTVGAPSPLTTGGTVSSGSSGSVCGSNAGVTSGSSSSSVVDATAASGLALAINGLVSRAGTTGAVWSGLVSGTVGWGGFSSCGSTRRSVYRRCTTPAAGKSLRQTRWSGHLRRPGPAAAPPSRPRRRPPGHNRTAPWLALRS